VSACIQRPGGYPGDVALLMGGESCVRCLWAPAMPWSPGGRCHCPSKAMRHWLR